jgi:hypothetical protein
MAYQSAAASLDTDTIQLILSNHERLKERRAFYESTWREIDRYVDPHGAGGWDKSNPTFSREVDDLFDVTALDGLDRYTAAIAGITIPRQQRWHGIAFADKELMKLPSVKRWCAHAADRLFTARYAPNTGFEAQAHEDIRQEGKYGTSAMWVGEVVGKGLFYKTLHMSEIFIDEDYSGRVDTVHRGYVCTLRNAVAEFGIESLSDRARMDFEDPKKRNNEIQILHVIRPNRDFEPGHFGPKGKPIESLYLDVAEKFPMRRSGFRKMPIPVSRHVTGPRDVYGRSPAMKVLATVKGLNAMARTILDAANKAVDPPLLYADDADITKVVTKPGGLTAGGVDSEGHILVHPLMTGGQIPVGLEIQQSERQVVKVAFLEEFFRLLSDPSDRMTATQVMETLQKEGVLIAPFAGRRETEKLGPQIERELDIMMNAKAIDDLPPEVLEAGASPVIQMTNPLSRMARAEEVTGFSRWVEMGIQAAGAGRPDALDRVNFDDGMVNAAEVLGVKPTSVYSDDELAAQRQAKQDRQDAAQQAEMAPQLSDAALNMAKAREIQAKLGEGGGL